MIRGNKNFNKRGQITIFIIIAMILVVAIIILFLLIRKPQLQVSDVENPQAYIDSCTRQFTEEAIGILSKQGGDIKPQGSVMYEDVNITYLCYNSEYYKPCIMQRPMLIEHIQDEITAYIKPKVEDCFLSLKTELEKKNYDIKIGNMQLQTKLQIGQVVIDINRDFKMTKNENTRSINNFKSVVINPIYDLAKIATEISNEEAKQCEFDILDFMIYYPKYDLRKFRTGDSDNIYFITDLATKQKLNFAIKSCVLPAGY